MIRVLAVQAKNIKSVMDNKNGFTLIELLIVIAIIVIIAVIIFVALDPALRFASARNTTRWQETDSILNAILKFQADHDGDLPAGIDTNLRMIGTATSGCDIACGATSSSSTSTFIDDDAGDFSGTYTNTQWNGGSNWIELSNPGVNPTGSYESTIKDAGSSIPWNNIAWTPQQPFYKQLPDNGTSESGYPSGNINMTSNSGLWHLNESSGTINDSSGNGNNGTNSGANYGAVGQFDTALDFNGTGDIIHGPPSNDITGDNLQTITFSAWVKHTHSGDNGYIASLKRSASPSTLISLDAGNGGAGNLGFLTRNNANTNHSWLNHSGGYNDGEWHHLVGVVDGLSRQLYIDGVLRNSDNQGMQDVTGNIAEFTIGGFHDGWNLYFDGTIDEVSIWNRALSGPEITDLYRRGANRLKFQVRSCDDAACSGESFMGPDGTGATYYSELENSSTSLPSLALSNVVDNQYFQYQVDFETDSGSLTPELNSTTISGTGGGGGGELTQPSCLNLTPELVDYYLTSMPEDPKDGTDAMTYYAIKKTPNDRIYVKSCAPELDVNIYVQR